jgi:hypothetical protein
MCQFKKPSPPTVMLSVPIATQHKMASWAPSTPNRTCGPALHKAAGPSSDAVATSAPCTASNLKTSLVRPPKRAASHRKVVAQGRQSKRHPAHVQNAGMNPVRHLPFPQATGAVGRCSNDFNQRGQSKDLNLELPNLAQTQAGGDRVRTRGPSQRAVTRWSISQAR